MQCVLLRVYLKLCANAVFVCVFESGVVSDVLDPINKVIHRLLLIVLFYCLGLSNSIRRDQSVFRHSSPISSS